MKSSTASLIGRADFIDKAGAIFKAGQVGLINREVMLQFMDGALCIIDEIGLAVHDS